MENDTLYYERSGGKWVSWVYSDGKRYSVKSTYSLSELEAYARKNHYNLLYVA